MAASERRRINRVRDLWSCLVHKRTKAFVNIDKLNTVIITRVAAKRMQIRKEKETSTKHEGLKSKYIGNFI